MAANVGVLGRAQVEVKADTKKLKTGLKGAENSVKTSTQKMSAAFKMLGTAVVAMGLARIVKDVTAAFKVQETAVRNIQVAIEQQGGSWARLRKEVLQTASDLQGKTIYGDEETLAGMTAAINAGGDYATVLKRFCKIYEKFPFICFDMMKSKDGKVYVIESNAQPGVPFDSTVEMYKGIYEDFYKKPIDSKSMKQLDSYAQELIKKTLDKEKGRFS